MNLSVPLFKTLARFDSILTVNHSGTDVNTKLPPNAIIDI